MKIGIVGLGVVGGTLDRWFKRNMNHDIKRYDPDKGFHDSMIGCEAVFIAIPVNPSPAGGQDQHDLDVVVQGLKYQGIKRIFIRSSVLPGTAQRLGCIAFPEFLTERRADKDMEDLPLLIGGHLVQDDHEDGLFEFCQDLFGAKQFIWMTPTEAELAKYTHNCFGALKVTYFNMIRALSMHLGCDYEVVLTGAKLTGFINDEHTRVPGPDGRLGYGGKCFPVNMESFKGFLAQNGEEHGAALIATAITMNKEYRGGL